MTGHFSICFRSRLTNIQILRTIFTVHTGVFQTMFTYVVSTLFVLLFAHALGDFALQTDYIAMHKSRKVAPDHWAWVLSAHSFIHGGAVFFATGSIVLGLLETITHGSIDFAKSEGKLSFNQDQLLHVACKVLWVILLVVTPDLVGNR